MKLFGIKDNYGNGKWMGEWYGNKMAAKEERDVLNGPIDDENLPRVYQLRVGPDHWRYVK